jgi:transposase InsO family protein
LQRLPACADQRLPSRARIAAFLHERGLTRRYQKHRALPPAPPGTPGTPHHEWQLDAQGATEVAGVGTVVLVNVADVVSRLKIESYPHLTSTQPAIADYQLVLRRAFTEYGLPERISFDHASAFYDNTTPSPFPTRLHLWLIALGVAVVFSRVRTPTDHALIERTHQTMTLQALLGQSWPDQGRLWNGLDSRRDFLNSLLPSRALGQPPLQAFPSARHSGRAYRPEWEADLLDLARVAAYLAPGQWFRRANCHGEWSVGHQRYRLGPRAAHREIAITFDPQSWELVCLPEGADQPIRVKAQGLTKVALMGELAPVLTLPVHQLALPFTREDWRRLALIHSLGDTTL